MLICNSSNVFYFYCVVYDRWVHSGQFHFGLTVMCFRSVFTNLLNFWKDLLSCLYVVISYSSLHERLPWHYIVSASWLDIANCESEVLFWMNASRLNAVQSGENVSRCIYRVPCFVWGWTVAAVTLDSYFDNGHFGKYSTIDNSNLSCVKIRYVMQTINFVNTFKTAFFYHRLSTSWSLFSWLEKKSNCLIWGYLITTSCQYLSSCKHHSHMSVMSTHVSIVRYCFIIESYVEFGHGQSIYISP